jgi:hypothetical protein
MRSRSHRYGVLVRSCATAGLIKQPLIGELEHVGVRVGVGVRVRAESAEKWGAARCSGRSRGERVWHTGRGRAVWCASARGVGDVSGVGMCVSARVR